MRFARSTFVDTVSKGLDVTYRRWTGPLPGLAEDAPWPHYCLPFEGDTAPTEGGPESLEVSQHRGNYLPIISRDAQLNLGVYVARPPAARGLPMPKFQLWLFGRESATSVPAWKCLGLYTATDTEVTPAVGDLPALRSDPGVDVDCAWTSGKGALMAIPVDWDEWANVTGFYDIELSVHGTVMKPYKYVDPNKDANPDNVDAGPEAPPPVEPGPNRKARRAAKKVRL